MFLQGPEFLETSGSLFFIAFISAFFIYPGYIYMDLQNAASFHQF